MNFFWIKFRRDTGDVVCDGHSSARSEMLNQADEEFEVVEVDEDAARYVDMEIGGRTIAVRVPDLDVVRRTYMRKVDEAALSLISDPFWQVHALKAAEARGGGSKPMIAAEAKATGKKQSDIAASVLAKADAATALQIAVEAKRQAAHDAIEAADNVHAIKAAAAVDWEDRPEEKTA